MKLFKNIFNNKEKNIETQPEVVKEVKEKKRTMPEINQKELYRIEKEKKRKAAAQKRQEEAEKKEAERLERLAKIKAEEENKKMQQEKIKEAKTAEVETKKVQKEVKVEEEKLDLFGYEVELLAKGQTIKIELMSEDNSNFYGRSLVNYQEVILPKIELDSIVNIGDEIEVLVFKFYAEEFYVSERRLNNKNRSAKLDGAYQQNDIVEAKVIKYTEPFFTVELADGITAKVYHANIDTKFVNAQNAEEYLNNSYKFNIKRKIKKAHSIDLELERKSIIQAQENERFEQINLGDRFTVENFSANKGGLEFDYDGFRGFIPLSEVSYFFYKDSKEALAHIDTPKEVEVIELKTKRNKTIVCSIKACELSPWEIIKSSYQTGDTITRDVIGIKDFGLIFEIEKNVHGLLHTSEMSDELINEINNVSIGDTVTFMIKDIDIENQKIALTNIKE